MAKFVGLTGLVYLWGKIKNYIANYVKIISSTGKDTITAGTTSVDIYDWAQSSTKPSYNLDEITEGTTNKPFTSTEKTKLSNIAAGAEVNQNAFSNVKVGSTTVAADGKTDTLELAAGSNVTLTPDATNDKVTIAVTTGAIPAATTTTPKMDGTAAVGSETKWAKGDHVHPTDTSRQAVIADLADIRSGAAAGATAYQLPNGGIPKTDLASAVQTSLDKADTAMQSSDLPVATTTTPKMDGTAAVGSETKWAKGDHVHPTDTSRAPLASPNFTGTPKAPTAAAGTNTTQVATTAFVTTAVGNVTTSTIGAIPTSQKGAASGVCPLDANTKIDPQYLPSYVDDVIEVYIRSGLTALSSTWLATGSATGTVVTPEAGKIYVLMNSDSTYTENTQFRWGGTTYVKLNDGGISELTTTEMDTATNNWT